MRTSEAEPAPEEPREINSFGTQTADEHRPGNSYASAVFVGDGELADLMRSFDWSRTPLGAVEEWSQSLRTMVRFLLANRFPLLLWWGPQYLSLYNDAYRPILGRKHPTSLGQPVSECWDEIWHILKPLIDTPFHGGPSTWMEDIPLEINRYGFIEETHFTVAYSPVPDETAPRGIGGVLATVHEITEQVIGERRTEVLRDLGAHSTEASTAGEACLIAARVLSTHGNDVPFAMLYLLDDAGKRVYLVASAGVEMGESISPLVVELGNSGTTGRETGLHETVRNAVRTETIQTLETLESRFDSVPLGPWSDAPSSLVALPIPSNKAHVVAGVLVAALSSRLAFDEKYQTFLTLVTTQIATAIANAREYEEERKRAAALAEIDKAKTLFFTNVSHEFRTPLTLLLGPLEDVLRRESGMDARSWDDLKVAHRNALRLLRLVNSLLDFSRIEAGRMDVLYEPTELAEYTAELASTFRSATERAGLGLKIMTEELPESVWVDRSMWEKIVLNLVSNAFKHTFDGWISVRVRAEGKRALLEIRDTGVGIPIDQLPRLFERFHRVSNARSRTHEGTGIGLALVQELVKFHGGTIRVESNVDVGTTITIDIPFGTAHLPPDRISISEARAKAADGSVTYVEEALRWLPSVSEAPTASLLDTGDPLRDRTSVSDIRVLVADDNADMRDYLTRLLRERGWTVDAVTNGQEALDAIRARAPDLVLADVMMPGIDGFGLLGEIRSDARINTVPIILLSARAGEESRVEGLGAGADDYLVKPFSARELIAKIDATLKLSRARLRTVEVAAAARDAMMRVFEQAPVAICVLRGRDHVYELANPYYRKLVGGRDLIGRPIKEAIPESVEQGYVALLDGVSRAGVPYLGHGMPVVFDRHGNGQREEAFFNFVIHPYVGLDDSGGLIFVLTEITEEFRRREEADVARADADTARQAAESANRAKSDFLAAMSHELRTPLNAIAGHAQLLEMGVYGSVNDAQRGAVERIQRSEQYLLSIINDVLNFAKLEAGRVEYEIGDVPLGDVVNEILPMIEPQLGAKRIVYEVRVHLDVTARADREKVRQILLNLLSNAIKFTPAGGNITVDVPMRKDEEMPPGVVFLRVSDTGIGIPLAKCETIFDPFVQVHRDMTRNIEGTGLGLAISRDLARGMGGDLRVRSIEGAGSTFTLTLPESFPSG